MEEIVEVKNKELRIMTLSELKSLGDIMVKSGLFADVKSASQAIVKIMAGRELGLGVFASMSSLQVIKGNVTLSGNLLASKVKASEKYDYTIKHLDDQGCIISFYQFIGGKPILLGESKFDEVDAIRAKLLAKDNWQNYPRNMYFNRALSNGVRLYCPDICYGITVYSPEEMDFAVEGEFTVSEEDLNIDEAAEVVEVTERPYSPEVVRQKIRDLANGMYKNKTANEAQNNLMIGMLEECFKGAGDSTAKRHELCQYLTGFGSSKKMPGNYVLALLKWIEAEKDDGSVYHPNEFVLKEAQTILTARLKELGQENLI